VLDQGSGSVTVLLLVTTVFISGLEKTRFFFLNQPSGFFGFFLVFFGFFWFFWGFFGFFVGFFGLFCPEERVLGFFSVSRILLGASRL
jgi:hypothetical protein